MRGGDYSAPAYEKGSSAPQMPLRGTCFRGREHGPSHHSMKRGKDGLRFTARVRWNTPPSAGMRRRRRGIPILAAFAFYNDKV